MAILLNSLGTVIGIEHDFRHRSARRPYFVSLVLITIYSYFGGLGPAITITLNTLR